MSSEQKLRYDWYQTDSLVVVTILVKGVDDSNLSITGKNNNLNVIIPLSDGSKNDIKIHLLHQVNDKEITHKTTPSKIEIKLKKLDSTRWNKLEREEKQQEEVEEPPKYPTSSLKPKDWDKVVTNIEEEQPEGEAALNALFSKIYTEGSDEVRKAMNKSFTESGGTVLSTNWGDVGKDKVNIQPPQGMEFKKWE